MWIVLVLVVICVAETARRVTARLGIPCGARGLVAWFVLAVSILVGGGTLIGAIGESVNIPAFGVGLVAICAALMWVASFLTEAEIPGSGGPRWRDWLPAVPRGALLRFLLIAVVIESIWLACLAGLFPLFAYDSIRYHVAAAGCWIQQGHIGFVETPSIFINTLPKNSEVLQMIALLLSRSDRFLDLIQLPFWILACVSVSNLSRHAGADERGAWLAAVLVFFTPMALCQCTTTYVDVVSAGLFLMSLDLIAAGCASDDFRAGARWTLLSGLAAGLMVGTKTDAIPRVLLLAAYPVLGSPGGIRNRVMHAGVFLAGTAALGSYWYVDSWIRYGNPVYPLGIAFGGRTLFPGLQVSAEFYAGRVTNLRGIWWTLVDREPTYAYDSSFAGYGPALLCLFLPATVFRLIDWRAIGWKKFILFVLVLMVVPLAVNPMRNPRFHLYLPGLGAVIFASIIPRLSRLTRRVVESASVACVLFVMWATVHQTFYDAKDMRRALEGMPLRPYEFEWGVDYRWAYHWKPEDGKIAYAGDHMIYYLMGSRLRNRILYIPPESEDAWLRRLGEEGVAILWLGNIDEAPFERIGAHREREWVAAHTELFEEVLRNYSGTLYRVGRNGP